MINGSSSEDPHMEEYGYPSGPSMPDGVGSAPTSSTIISIYIHSRVRVCACASSALYTILSYWTFSGERR